MADQITPLSLATDSELFDEFCRRHPEVLMVFARDGKGVKQGEYTYTFCYGGTSCSWAAALGLASFAIDKLRTPMQFTPEQRSND